MFQPSRADRNPAAPSCSLWYVAHRAGISDRAESFVLGYVQLLHKNEGFPPPLPDFVMKTGRKLDGVRRGSRWVREAVDAWFDGQLPPQLLALVADRRTARDAEILDARAIQLAAA